MLLLPRQKPLERKSGPYKAEENIILRDNRTASLATAHSQQILTVHKVVQQDGAHSEILVRSFEFNLWSFINSDLPDSVTLFP